MGARVALVTLERAAIARLSCNPAIGGLAKGHIVREIDALGGVMGLASDAVGIQFRMLNRSKGPAVWAPRAQQDKPLYTRWIVDYLDTIETIDIVEGMTRDLLTDDNGVAGVALEDGQQLTARAVVLCTGTFLDGKMHVGMEQSEGGRIGERAATGLTDSFNALGITSGRLKTGTPPRLHTDSIDYAVCEEQPGDDDPRPFSYLTERLDVEQVPCHITWTTPETHQIILDNLDRSPLYAGVIESVGPRYCPSIEDKVVRFADRPRHQVFLEPESRSTPLIYANGVSTSLPRDVQEAYIRSIPGLERAEFIHYGYAVEYTYIPPTQLRATLEAKALPGLYCAGQINGTSGYEEAGGQGLIAGVNAVLGSRDEGEFILGRDEAYIGVLIDDLVTKGVTEPYRMFTSRAEHRLILRQDNADLRLTERGRKLGLVDDQRWKSFQQYREKVTAEKERLRATRVRPSEMPEAFLAATQIKKPDRGLSLAELLTRSDVNYDHLAHIAPLSEDRRAGEQAAIQTKYAGYIKRQQEMIDRQRQWESRAIPQDFDYESIQALSRESRNRLAEVQPRTLAQAMRISGVTPADIEVLMIHLGRVGGGPEVRD